MPPEPPKRRPVGRPRHAPAGPKITVTAKISPTALAAIDADYGGRRSTGISSIVEAWLRRRKTAKKP